MDNFSNIPHNIEATFYQIIFLFEKNKSQSKQSNDIKTIHKMLEEEIVIFKNSKLIKIRERRRNLI